MILEQFSEIPCPDTQEMASKIIKYLAVHDCYSNNFVFCMLLLQKRNLRFVSGRILSSFSEETARQARTKNADCLSLITVNPQCGQQTIKLSVYWVLKTTTET